MTVGDGIAGALPVAWYGVGSRTSHEEAGAAGFVRVFLEDIDEEPPDCLALLLRLGDAGQSMLTMDAGDKKVVPPFLVKSN